MRSAAAALLLLAGSGTALAQPSSAQPGTDGRAVFAAHCASCHAVAQPAPPGPGPNLRGVLGRPVGGDPGFDYSPVLKAARRDGHVWDAPRLAEFLLDPEEMYPGLWMGGNVPRRAEERAAVLEYLGTLR